MSFQLFSLWPSLYFVCCIFLLLSNIQLSLSNNYMYQACIRQFLCQNITACYPFWGGDRQKACGYPDLELKCESGTPTIMINDVKYRVLKVDEKAYVLKIARQDYLAGICPPKLLNSTIDSSLFDYADGYETFQLVYGFPSPVPEQLTCSTQQFNYTDGFIQTVATGSGAFNVSVNVTVLEASLSAAKENQSALENALRQGFDVKVKVNRLELCKECIVTDGRCGYDEASRQTICYCPNGQVNLSTGCSPESFFNKRMKIAIALAVTAGGLMLVLSILLICGIRQKLILDKVLLLCGKKTKDHQNMEDFVRVYGSLAPQRYTYSEVKKMTKSFSNKLGQGGYGDVYKGNLPDGHLVAVKVLKSSEGNGDEFINEVASISRTSHVNIVAFLGFCYEREKRALIYEFMHNGSLDNFIYDQEPTKRKLEWKMLYQIAVGIARGLEYLHRGCNIRIVHFDIKPHNILLDEDFCPKISDFGLAKQSKKKESTISMLDTRGTAGYIAPEVFCRKFGVTYKSDVYSYGMMILEMVEGRRNINVTVSRTSEIYSTYKHLEPGKDFELQGVVNEDEEEMVKKMIFVGLWCTQINPSERPSMTKVVEVLEGSQESLQFPPESSWSSPTRPPKHTSSTSSSTQLASQGETSITLSDISYN